MARIVGTVAQVPLARRRRTYLQPEDLAQLLARYKELRRQGRGQTESCEMVGAEIGRPYSCVYEVIRRLRPTHELATAQLRAQAVTLANRIVKKANVEQANEVLS